jgi:large subunit ribosomal protein L25
MADFVIEAQPRTVTGKQVSQLRNQGIVPAVVYGSKTQPVHIQIPYRPLEVTLMKAGGTNLIDIQVDGKTHTVLTREVQRHIIKGSILHVDFVAIDLNQPITADVYIHFIGESPAVEAGQGMLLTGASSLSIETLPSNLPNHIEVDLSGLAELGDAIHVRDLDLGKGITIHNDPDELIVRVVQPASARAAEAEEEISMATVPPGLNDDEEEDEE